MTTATADTYLADDTVTELSHLQGLIGSGNRKRGFREDEELLDMQTRYLEECAADARRTGQETITLTLREAEEIVETLKKALVHSHANRLMLIVGEVVEAHEELRSGHGVNETYYIDEDGNKTYERFRADGTPRKPEGVPSEMADIRIRAHDFEDNAQIDGAGMTDEKLAYNETRPYRHGRKF